MVPIRWFQASVTPNCFLERSVAPVVGIVLLTGLVLLGSLLLVVTGFALTDQVLSETDRYHGTLCIEEFDHRATTVTTVGGDESLPCDALQFVDDGELHIIWHNESVTNISSDLDETFENTSVSSDLGAVEIESGDRTIAYQNSGIWEQMVEGTLIHSNPTSVHEYSENGQTILRLDLITLSESTIDATPTSITRDSDGTFDSSIVDAKSKATERDFSNLTIVLESKYHDGWYSHFSAEIEDGIVSTTDLAIDSVDEDRAMQVDLVDVIHPTSDYEASNANPMLGPSAQGLSRDSTHSEIYAVSEKRTGHRLRYAGSPGTLIDIYVHEIVLE